MSAEPHFPLLVVDPKGWLVSETGNRKSRFSLCGALNTKRWVGFDASGEKWLVSKESFRYSDTWWMRLLNTVYNPRFEAELRWEPAGHYTFSELQGQVCSIVDRDDDVLTQFTEAEEIKKAVHECQSFEELTARLRKMKVLRK